MGEGADREARSTPAIRRARPPARPFVDVARILLPAIPLDGRGAAARERRIEMAKSLQGKRVAMLVENGFEQIELTEPRNALHEAGAKAEVVSPVDGKVKGWNFTDWGEEVPVDTPLDQA
nr:hypothetical protein [Gammaproteobacteria bacterium]